MYDFPDPARLCFRLIWRELSRLFVKASYVFGRGNCLIGLWSTFVVSFDALRTGGSTSREHSTAVCMPL